MIQPDHSWPQRLTLMAAILTAAISAAIFASLVLRDSSSPNVFNLVSLIGTTQGAGLAFWFHRHPAGFAAGYLLFVAAVIPTTFGWIWLLYLPPLTILTIAAIVKIALRTRHLAPA